MQDTFLKRYCYTWPPFELHASSNWQVIEDGQFLVRELSESSQDLAVDSRWPALYPSPMCCVTTTNGVKVALEKVVGASIVNRFPYVIAPF